MNPERPSPESGKSSQPSVGRLAVPVWIFIVTLLLGYRGCMHIDHVAGDMAFRSDVYAPYRSPKEIEGVQPVFDDGGYRKGEVQYNSLCFGCHQTSGLGTPGAIPPLAGSEWVLADKPDRLIRIVLFGLQGPVSVGGSKFNGAMPLWSQLSDEQLAQILTYVRGSKPWGNNASIVTPEEVAAVRAAEKSRPLDRAWSADELQKIPLK
jgi:mono/diheme cytochrome c family protein